MSRRRRAGWPGRCSRSYIAVFAATLDGGVRRGDVGRRLRRAGVGFAMVGAVVATREPANPVGWLLLAIAVGFGGGEPHLRRTRGTPVFPAWWPSPGSSYFLRFVALYLAMILLPLLSPTGRPLTPRWRPAVALGAPHSSSVS